MKTVVKAKDKVAKSWGTAKPCNTEYRLLKYILRTDLNEGTLLCNNITGSLVLLDSAETEMIDSLPSAYSPCMDELISEHFLVPVDYDERQTVYSLRKLINLFSTKNIIYAYTILPTTNCNARCFYCYQADFEHLSMSEETADKLIDFMIKNCGNEKELQLSWFGGEPTLGINRIDKICNALQDAGIEYTSKMISNSYLFDEQTVKKAKHLWNLKHIQITLDGTEEVYNKVKAYVGITGSAYKRVLRNIQLFLDNEIGVSVRMNLDRHNCDDLEKLIDELAALFSKNKYFNAYVYGIFEDCGYAPVKHDAAEKLWLANKTLELNSKLRENDMGISFVKGIPFLRTNCCMADNDKTVVISPNGDITKCEHHCIDEAVGNIEKGIYIKDKFAEWKEIREYAECPECPLFPNCVNLVKCVSNDGCLPDTRANKIADYKFGINKIYEEFKNKNM